MCTNIQSKRLSEASRRLLPRAHRHILTLVVHFSTVDNCKHICWLLLAFDWTIFRLPCNAIFAGWFIFRCLDRVKTLQFVRTIVASNGCSRMGVLAFVCQSVCNKIQYSTNLHWCYLNMHNQSFQVASTTHPIVATAELFCTCDRQFAMAFCLHSFACFTLAIYFCTRGHGLSPSLLGLVPVRMGVLVIVF